jgi:hypothetical protein
MVVPGGELIGRPPLAQLLPTGCASVVDVDGSWPSGGEGSVMSRPVYQSQRGGHRVASRHRPRRTFPDYSLPGHTDTVRSLVSSRAVIR